MGSVGLEARRGLRYGVFGLAAVIAALAVTSHAADARHHRHLRVHYVHYVHYARHAVHVRHAHAEAYSPPFASIVVDGNSGEVLQATNPDALRHPASITKIMTLYLLFERLETGKIRLDTPLKISAHAAEQAPSKLGLKPGATIAVEDAIKAVVTKSANDIAVAIAENLAGDEDAFAKLMTQKAHALGMGHTTYVNASGLPDDDQITTARDQALLGRAIEDRFPRFYRYFSTPSFVYHGEAMRNHNHLLGSVVGVDGIKTGYTRASGFNLVTSVHRDGRYLIAVVLGGHSAFERDAHMRGLINTHIREASLRRTAPTLAERSEPAAEPPAAAPIKAAPPSRTNVASAAPTKPNANTSVGSNDPIQPLLVRTITYRTAPVQTASLAPMPTMVPTPGRGAQEPASPQPVALAAATPDAGAAIASTKSGPVKTGPAMAEIAKAEPTPPQAHARGGWLIQIGAFEGEDEAKQHLSAAQTTARNALASADAFTERVQKGEKALYRARFAGFDKATAEATCKELRRSDIACMALKN
jgi:D-alanyl-D-alanine carboxypeptidase